MEIRKEIEQDIYDKLNEMFNSEYKHLYADYISEYINGFSKIHNQWSIDKFSEYIKKYDLELLNNNIYLIYQIYNNFKYIVNQIYEIYRLETLQRNKNINIRDEIKDPLLFGVINNALNYYNDLPNKDKNHKHDGISHILILFKNPLTRNEIMKICNKLFGTKFTV